MTYEHIINACFNDKTGIDKTSFDKFYNDNFHLVEEIKKDFEQGKLPLLSSSFYEDDITEIKSVGDKIKNNFDNLVVLGIGGSTLNPQALVGLKQNRKELPRIYFIDNVDPYSIDSLLANIDLTKTAFLSTSKSGNTAETMAQTFAVLAKLEEAGIKNPGNQFFIITMNTKNPLRQLGEKINAYIMEHKSDIGGRFSTFTNVGLLPAYVAGVNPSLIRKGAANTLKQNLEKNSEAAKGAFLSYLLMQKKFTTTVMMPYVDRLSPFTIWFRQIWAESLGKDGKGTTPIRAVGTLDQHSQLQLYLDGPKDKMFTLINLDTSNKGQKFNSYGFSELDYLNGKTVGDVNAASQEATVKTLERNGCPVRVISLKKVDEEVLGSLLMHFILETIIMAKLLHLNPFDQPAVEEGKIIAREILKNGK